MPETTPRARGHAPSATSATARRTTVRILVAFAALVALFALGRGVGRYVPVFAERVNGLGPWGPAVFIIGYVVACVAFIPGSLLTLAAGAVFGLVEGVVIVFVGATLGAAAAFLIARYLARGLVERKLAGNARFAAIDRAIGSEGFKIVALLRLSPVFPFTLLNYALGLTEVRLVDYVLASIGMLPGTILYVYYGDVAAIAGGVTVHHGPEYYVVLVLGLVAAIAATAMITRVARRALQQATGPESQTTEMRVPSAASAPPNG
jgi:uncharacterized membrane protein YdjX (TVP38/TMEM64 family)